MEPPDKDVHAKFRTLLKLTELVAAINNNNNHPTLHPHCTPTPPRPPGPIDEVLFAISTILVRDNEVVAVGVSGPNLVAMQQQEETASSEPDSSYDQPDFANDRQLSSTPLLFDEDLDYPGVRTDTVTAVLNPREEGIYTFPSGRCCILVSGGKPLMEQQWKDDGWQRFHEQTKR